MKWLIAAASLVFLVAVGGYLYHNHMSRKIEQFEQLRLEAEKKADLIHTQYEAERENRLNDFVNYRDAISRLDNQIQAARDREQELLHRVAQATSATHQSEIDLQAAVHHPIPEADTELADRSTTLLDALFPGGADIEILPLPDRQFSINRQTMELIFRASRELGASRNLITDLRLQSSEIAELSNSYKRQLNLFEEKVDESEKAIESCLRETTVCRDYTEALQEQLKHTEDQLSATQRTHKFNLFRPRLQAGGGLCVSTNGLAPCLYVGLGWSF